VILGVFLLAAAGLKAYGLALDPLSQESFLGSPRVQVAAVEIETLLGLWLLSGRLPRLAWGCALGFFGLLAGVSLLLALDGQRSCGCLGRVEASPWLAFAFDLGAVVSLLIWRPARELETRPVVWLGGLLKTVAGTVAFLTLIGGAFLLLCDNPNEALARLRGEAITVEPAVSQVGQAVAGEQRTFAVRLTNIQQRPVRIVGGSADCFCIATDDLPFTLRPGQSRSIQVRVTFRGGGGRFQHRFVFYTDDEKQAAVAARFGGRVTKPRTPLQADGTPGQ
jgi:hypothetical protein